jgi:hypothetical protein
MFRPRLPRHGTRTGGAVLHRLVSALLAVPLLLVTAERAGAQALPATPQVGQADLQVENLYPDFYPSGYGFLGEVHIYNAGTASADSFTVRLEVDGVYAGYAKVNGVLAGNHETAYFSNQGALYQPPVTHKLGARLDVFNHIPESNESNNFVEEPIYIDAPALDVDHITPDVLHTGQTGTFIIWVKNSGKTAAAATKTYFGALIGSFPTHNAPICEFIATPSIPAGGMVSVQCSVGPVNWATLRKYTACADYLNEVPEEYEGNCLITNVSIAGPDLVIDRIDPDQAAPGQSFTARVYVRNQGQDAAVATTTRVRLVGGATWNLATPALAAGQTTSVTCTIPAQPAGTITIEATADQNAQVAETDENNTRSETVSIAIADLVVSRVQLSQIWSGIPINVYITVRNQGTAAAPASATRLTVDNVVKCNAISTPSILAGDSTIVTCSAGSFSLGLHSFVACADVNGQVAESDEGNNCRTMSSRFWTTIPIRVRADGTGDYPTIQAAIDAASDYGAVELASGTYTGTGNRDLDFKGKKIRVYSQSGVPSQCVIDCQATAVSRHRGFLFTHSEDSSSVLEGIRIRNGYAIRGGGIYCSSSSPRLKNLRIDHCTSWTDGGGGVLLDHSSPTLEDCAIEYCTAVSVGGGGLYAHDYSSPRLTNVSFRKNSGSDRGGGALFSVNCFPTLQYCFFDCNQGVNGGGLTFVSSYGPVRDCLFSNNVADYGGAMQCYGNAQATIERCTFYGNDGKYASGIYLQSGSSPAINNTIISYGLGGPALERYASDCNPTLSCTDLWMNGGGTADWVGFIGPQQGLRGNRRENPLFCASYSDNFMLQGASPCAPGNNKSCGQIGRFGVGCNFVVTVRPDGSGDYPTIQAAIDALPNGSVIELANGQFTGTGNRDLDLHGKRLTIRSASGNRAQVQIDCQGSAGSHHRAFYFHSHEDSLTILQNFTIARGYAVDGGGILIDGSSPRLENISFDACHATDEGGGICATDSCNSILTGVSISSCRSDNDGGGMCFLTWSSPRLTDCWLVGNQAVDLGGGALFSVNCFPILNGCRFQENRAARGAGLMFVYAFGPVTNGFFWENVASSEGGGLNCYGNAQVTVDGCTFYGNMAPLGGGIYCRNNSSPPISHTVIAGSYQGGAIGRLETNNNPTLSCTNLWGNTGGNWSGFLAAQQSLRNNLSLDPLFCDPMDMNFTVYDNSSCLPAHNSCAARIGAFGSGCTLVDVPPVADLPEVFFARANAPNPFHGSTTVIFGLPRAADVTLRIYDIAGRVVRELVPGQRFEPGVHQVRWDGRSDDGAALRAGVYFYQLVAGSDRVTRRMIRIQ